MKKHLLDKTVIKFLAVGVVNTLVGCGTMFLLYNLAHCSLLGVLCGELRRGRNRQLLPEQVLYLPK